MFSCCHDSKMRAFTSRLHNRNSGERSHLCNMSSTYLLASFKIGNIIEGQFFASLLEYYHPSSSINGATFNCLKGVVPIVLQGQLELQLKLSIEKCHFNFFFSALSFPMSLFVTRNLPFTFSVLFFAKTRANWQSGSFILSQYLLLKAPLCV